MKHAILCSMITASIVAASFATRAGESDTSKVLHLQTRSRVESPDGKCRTVYKKVRWDPKQTAIVVCDMWDKHWCRGATARVGEMAPRMDEFLKTARQQGVLIVHAPSSCMGAYDDHPARKRAREAKKADLPDFLRGWNRKLDSEKDIAWPIDQSDGGCDCRPQCPQGGPWRRQVDTLTIHDQDAVSDSGVEIGNLFTERGIENVMLVGVHTNMCVIGRPFGLRNMVRFGKKLVLVRDLTDTMYNSRKAPHVSHVRGTELIVEYIEKCVCPTITSSALLAGPAFRFAEDQRPHVAIIVSDDHYHADKTLPAFAEELRKRYGCHCTVIHGEGTSRFPAMEEIKAADVAVLYIRRLALPKGQLDLFRAYLDGGKPLVAMRTASHAFAVHGQTPDGHDQWREFDAEVLGGNYHGHGSNKLGSNIVLSPDMADHPILAGVKPAKWHSTGSLYYTAPVKKDATVLMTGSVAERTEPVTWIRKYNDARVFYTSLGHPDDFRQPQFRRLLANAVFWAMDRPLPRAAAEKDK